MAGNPGGYGWRRTCPYAPATLYTQRVGGSGSSPFTIRYCGLSQSPSFRPERLTVIFIWSEVNLMAPV